MMKIIMMIFMLNFFIFFININLLMKMIYNFLMMILLIYFMNINFNNYWMNLYNLFGLDNISNMMIILTFWIVIMMFMIKINKNIKFYSFILLFLMMFLILSFYSMNYFMFYLFFEISLIPTFILIIMWGYQPERINASMFMLLYTMFASLPLLILIFYLYFYYNSLNYFFLLNNIMNYNFMINFMFYLFMLLAYLIKLPIFIFHMWLPKAHVEAPVTGSMILAGVMLKLGGYGIIRSMMMMMNYCLKFNYLIMIFNFLGLLILSMMCLRQFDMKLLVAYSSVVHMSIMLMGLMMMMIWSFMGGILMMLGHGLCSSGLFYLVNLLYERSKSRNMIINKGMIFFIPTLSMWWFLFCVSNMSAPITLNLLSELMIINVLLNWSMNMILIFFLGMFISAIYSLYLFSYCQHGKFMNLLKKIYLNNINEYLVLILHWIPLNFIVLKMELLI